MEWCELRLEGLYGLAVLGEVVALEWGEVVEDAGGGRGGDYCRGRSRSANGCGAPFSNRVAI